MLIVTKTPHEYVRVHKTNIRVVLVHTNNGGYERPVVHLFCQLLGDNEVIVFPKQMKTRKPKTTKHDIKSVQEIYLNVTRKQK